MTLLARAASVALARSGFIRSNGRSDRPAVCMSGVDNAVSGVGTVSDMQMFRACAGWRTDLGRSPCTHDDRRRWPRAPDDDACPRFLV